MSGIQGSQHCSVFWQLSTELTRSPSAHVAAFSDELFLRQKTKIWGLGTADGRLILRWKKYGYKKYIYISTTGLVVLLWWKGKMCLCRRHQMDLCEEMVSEEKWASRPCGMWRFLEGLSLWKSCFLVSLQDLVLHFPDSSVSVYLPVKPACFILEDSCFLQTNSRSSFLRWLSSDGKALEKPQKYPPTPFLIRYLKRLRLFIKSRT